MMTAWGKDIFLPAEIVIRAVLASVISADHAGEMPDIRIR
jgi:hypothetical protein